MSTCLVRLPPGTAEITLEWRNAYGPQPLDFREVEVCYLAAEADRQTPRGAVGLAAADVEQFPELLAEIVEHYAHYRQTAAGLARRWSEWNNPARVLAELLSQRPSIPMPGSNLRRGPVRCAERSGGNRRSNRDHRNCKRQCDASNAVGLRRYAAARASSRCIYRAACQPSASAFASSATTGINVPVVLAIGHGVARALPAAALASTMPFGCSDQLPCANHSHSADSNSDCRESASPAVELANSVARTFLVSPTANFEASHSARRWTR